MTLHGTAKLTVTSCWAFSFPTISSTGLPAPVPENPLHSMYVSVRVTLGHSTPLIFSAAVSSASPKLIPRSVKAIRMSSWHLPKAHVVRQRGGGGGGGGAGRPQGIGGCGSDLSPPPRDMPRVGKGNRFFVRDHPRTLCLSVSATLSHRERRRHHLHRVVRLSTPQPLLIMSVMADATGGERGGGGYFASEKIHNQIYKVSRDKTRAVS